MSKNHTDHLDKMLDEAFTDEEDEQFIEDLAKIFSGEELEADPLDDL